QINCLSCLLSSINETKIIEIYPLDQQDALPVYPKTYSYQHFIVLITIHVNSNDLFQETENCHDIDNETVDKRKGILEKYQEWNLPEVSSVCVNDKFEKRCLDESAAIFTEYKDWLKSIQDNFLDLATPFWGYEYYHPDQKGST
ncbi:DUF2779 domain-containing protein, partial [Leptospira borgpetersenii serovar Hardjo-bovis]|nr:DUF2779 domain-containing protein [Leptospira borgpetersenii serovar Hardjo-bovis]